MDQFLQQKIVRLGIVLSIIITTSSLTLHFENIASTCF